MCFLNVQSRKEKKNQKEEEEPADFHKVKLPLYFLLSTSPDSLIGAS